MNWFGVAEDWDLQWDFENEVILNARASCLADTDCELTFQTAYCLSHWSGLTHHPHDGNIKHL